MDDDDEVPTCPLCLEELDATDRAVNACQCGYQVSFALHILLHVLLLVQTFSTAFLYFALRSMVGCLVRVTKSLLTYFNVLLAVYAFVAFV